MTAALAAGCSDSPLGPQSSLTSGADVQPVDASTQSATVATAVAVAPAVLVRAPNGQAAPGVTVTFAVTQGGGSIQKSVAVTDAAGIASAGKWTLGSSPGMNEVTATTAAGIVRFTATGVAPTSTVAPPPATTGAYSISLRYVASLSARQQQAVLNAVSRWQSVITRDVQDIPLNVPGNSCFQGQPALQETVDDIIIFVEFVSIDGVGKVLGEAGPCYVRSDSKLPIIGHLKLDTSDLLQMEQAGTLDDVVLHEMGHILGIGTLWSDKALVVGAGSEDPTFTGAYANAAYRSLGGSAAAIPVENSGAEGTRDGHWRESVFGNELMTGYISSSVNPMSAMTIASLQDLGYGANQSVAATYTIGGRTGRITAPLEIGRHERTLRPKFEVDRHGRFEKFK